VRPAVRSGRPRVARTREQAARRPDRLRHQAQGLLVFALGLAVTSGSLRLLEALAPDASRAVELGVLTAANVVATLLRFVLYRAWVFRARTAPAGAAPPAAATGVPVEAPAHRSTEEVPR
jgi:hypothetical protein